MLKRSDELRRWWSSVEPLRQLPGVKIAPSIDQFLADLQTEYPGLASYDEDPSPFLESLFEYVFEKYVRPVLRDIVSLDDESRRLFRAFCRWITGQLALCSKFHFLPESAALRSQVISRLSQFGDGKSFTLADASSIRVEFESFLRVLNSRNLISPDDAITFAEGSFVNS